MLRWRMFLNWNHCAHKTYSLTPWVIVIHATLGNTTGLCSCWIQFPLLIMDSQHLLFLKVYFWLSLRCTCTLAVAFSLIRAHAQSISLILASQIEGSTSRWHCIMHLEKIPLHHQNRRGVAPKGASFLGKRRRRKCHHVSLADDWEWAYGAPESDKRLQTLTAVTCIDSDLLPCILSIWWQQSCYPLLRQIYPSRQYFLPEGLRTLPHNSAIPSPFSIY